MIPDGVKEKLGLTENDFKDKIQFIKVSIGHEVSKAFETFDHVFCKVCTKSILPNFIKKHKEKLPEDPKISDFISNWDNLNAKESMIDLCGCILHKEEHVNAEPNARRFLVRPNEHANAMDHWKTIASDLKQKDTKI